MPRKKLDSRIRSVIESGVRQRYRTLFVIVGDRAREQIVNLHYMLSKAQVRARPNVLWCYKKNLGFNSTVVAMRAADPRKKGKWSSGGSGAGTGSAAFNEFVSTTEIRYAHIPLASVMSSTSPRAQNSDQQHSYSHTTSVRSCGEAVT